MALSSNSVIHFTKSLKSLTGILKDDFKIFYCREKILSNKKNLDLLIPMVSFCDIPFSQIINHITNYGSYGIGLKKNWAEEKGLNPVLYLEKKSSLANTVTVNLLNTIKKGKKNITELEADEKYNFDYLRYLKNYQADLIRRNKKPIENYRFSDEREWRYVPNPLSKCQIFASLEKVEERNVTKAKEILNDLAKDERLEFNLEDISYIIIKKETERDKIIKLLEHINEQKPHNQVKRLMSRIITVEQLKTDF